MLYRTLPILLALVTLGGGIPGPARAATSGVRDRAGMFSKKAVEETIPYLRSIERETGWQVIIETVESLEGKPIEEAALAGAKSSQVHGLYILIAKKEHKLFIVPSPSAEKVFTHEKIRRLLRRMEATFHAKEYDEGLFRAVGEIRDDIVRSEPAKASAGTTAEVEPGVPARPMPIPVEPQEEKDGGRGRGIGRSTPGIVGLALICLGVLVFFWLAGKIIRRVIQFVGGPTPGPSGAPYTAPGPGPGMPVSPQPGPGYGAAPQPGPGYGAAPRPVPPMGAAPGYGPPMGPAPSYGPPTYPTGPGYPMPPQPPSQGGGFVSGALGGLGGAVLGNVLYDKFGRPHPGQEVPQGGAGVIPPAHSGHERPVEPLPDSPPPEPPAESYDPNAGAGGDWDAPEPETAEGQPGADWGGGDGGDWGDAAAPPAEAEPGAGGDWGGGDEPSGDDPGGGAGGDWDAPEGGADENQGGSW